jgi:uncharacterized repeat protein (TIGR01451 family)
MNIKSMLGLALALGAATAAADDSNCIQVTAEAHTPQQYVNEQGQTATRLVPVVRALPGDEVIWTVTTKNTCNTAIDNVVVANPVPQHMTYVADSALGVGTAIAYSLDGQQFGPLNALSARAADGSTHLAKPDDVRHIRWTYANAFEPGATAFVRYRALLN